MDEKARQLRREYQRAYNKANRDKINQQKREWYAQNAEEIREKRRKWNSENKDKNKLYRESYWRRKAEQTGPTCLYCDQSFEPKRSDAKFCSTKCRVNYNRKKQ